MTMLRLLLVLTLGCGLSLGLYAQTMPQILPLSQQAALRDAWLQQRARTILPELMRREGIDMWVLISREYNEDPVLKTFLPALWLSARRTTMLLIYDTGDTLQTLTCARYNVGELFQKAWDPDQQPDQWARLAELIAARNPRRIAVNRSVHFGLADGISAQHYAQLEACLPPALRTRLVSAERLAIGWLETRLPEEMAVYPQIMRIAHHIIAEGLSEAVIQPGVTTTDDVVWWYRERVRHLGLEAWFHPSVDVQRPAPGSPAAAPTAAPTGQLYAFSGRPEAEVIMPGDLVHVDFGITYLGLNTDTQQNAYVCKPHETAAPAYLQAAHQQGLRLMDILTAEYRTGRTGNEILASALTLARAEGLRPTIYTHPIGYHGHGAGPTIGLWDQQGGVPHQGDYPIYPHTAYSIELNHQVFIPEWGKDVRIMLEEDAYFDGQTVRYIDGRQTELYLIPRQLPHHGR